MSTVVLMAGSSDIPFESEEEIATRLACYEKQFSNRYTEEDDWYAGTCQRTGRWHQVPVMSPWPPKGGFPKKKRRGGYPDRRNRDRGDRGYHSLGERYSQYEGHSYGRSSGSEHYSRSPRHGYYGSGRQDRSPHDSPHSSSWGEQGHHRQQPLSPSSHDHDLHPPLPPVSHADHTLYPEDEPPYLSHREQESLRPGSRSPGSHPWQHGYSSTGHGDDSEDQRQWGHPGYNGNEQLHVEQQYHKGAKGEDDDTTASSQSSVGRDASLVHETEATSSRVKAVAPPPLDLSIGEEEHVVPSQSDVMDILNVASKGANDVTAENLKQVQRETQIQAARKTMKNRQKQQYGKTAVGKSSTKTATITQSKVHKGRQKEPILVTHGHTKNVSHSRLLEGGKPISKTHALLQESIIGAAKESSTAPSTSTVQRSKTAAILANEGVGDPTLTHSKSISTKPKKRSGKEVATRVKQKRRKVVRTELCSSSENEELDVVTPDSDTTSLSISLRRDFKSESSQVPLYTNEQKRREIRGNVMLSSEDLASDTSDEAMDTTQSTEPSSLCVKINRNLIPNSLSMEDGVYKPMLHREQVEDPEHSDSLHESPSYALEYNPSKSTKMVIRTNPLPCMEVEGQEAVSGVGVPSVAKAKKKKKKHKHKKVKISDDLKLKISLT